MRVFLLTFLIVCPLFTLGCNNSGSDSGSVAVVDLDQVALQVGRVKAIATAVEKREADLNQQLAQAKSSYENQLQEAKQRLGEEPTEDQKQHFAKLKLQANKQLNQVAKQAKQNLQQHQTQLRLKFRNDAKAVARQVAKEKGLSIVVTKNDSVVLVYDDAADITGEVVERLQLLSSPKAKAPTAPLGQAGW